ncbi:AlkZ-related protein [Paenibacillus sp. FA6]|uniref:AlkZ-related protein n=1 Tax=Paenibacillus sp. FA6 TaxID=3413029 RepID=UPI003F65E497
MKLELEQEMIHTYEEATQLIQRVGILPLATIIPSHPSLGSVTDPNQWHTSSELDPRLWRARFPGDGTAAYGKILKKKVVLVSRDWYPHVLKVHGHIDKPDTRYKNGLLSKAALDVYQCIENNEGIDTRELRGRAGMKAKEMKSTRE